MPGRRQRSPPASRRSASALPALRAPRRRRPLRTRWAYCTTWGMPSLHAWLSHWITRVAPRSAPAQGSLERLQQRRLAEGLEQACHGPLGEQAGRVGLIAVRGDEDDRNRVSAPRQFPLELEAGHARHGDVEEETLGLAETRGHEEGFRRRKRLDRKAALPQQVGQRLAHGLVVIDDRHQGTLAHHGLLMTGAASVTAGRPVAAGLSGPAPPPPPPRTTKANATPAP